MEIYLFFIILFGIEENCKFWSHVEGNYRSASERSFKIYIRDQHD